MPVVVLTALIYLGLHLVLDAHAHYFRSQHSITAWYPPIGLALAYLICCGRNRWPVVVLAFYLGIILIWKTNDGHFDSLRIALSNTLAAYAGAYMLRKRDRLPTPNWSLEDLAALVLAGLVSGGVSGLLILGYWHFTGAPFIKSTPIAIVEWLLGDLIGVLLIVPVMLIVVSPVARLIGEKSLDGALRQFWHAVRSQPARLAEILGFVLSFAVLIYWVFLSEHAQVHNLYFLNFIPVLWAVLRQGFVGAALTAIAIDAFGLTTILVSGIPAGFGDDIVAIRYFQIFALLLAIVAFTLGITVDRLKQARSELDWQSRNLEIEVERRTRQLAQEIEERKRIEDQLRRLNESLEQRVLARTEALNDARKRAERANEAKTQFLQNMSHELRTPLNAIIGFAQILREEMLGPLGNPKYRDYVRDILAAGNHLLALVGDLLEMASLSGEDRPFRMEPCSLGAVIDAVRVMAEPKADSTHVRLVMERPEPDLLVMGDHSSLVQILLNLVSNAVKFAPAGDGTVRVSISRSKDEVIVEVVDNGPGIPPADLPHVFERFWRGSRADLSGGGMGLGLAIAKSLAERHGGSLRIESGPGEGTRAILAFPLLAGNASSDGEAKGNGMSMADARPVAGDGGRS